MEKLITHRYKESTVEHYCDFCQRHITTTNINEDLPSQYKGQNWGIGGKKEIRCQSCKSSMSEPMTITLIRLMRVTDSPLKQTT